MHTAVSTFHLITLLMKTLFSKISNCTFFNPIYQTIFKNFLFSFSLSFPFVFSTQVTFGFPISLFQIFFKFHDTDINNVFNTDTNSDNLFCKLNSGYMEVSFLYFSYLNEMYLATIYGS